jgi:hypothetical protein
VERVVANLEHETVANVLPGRLTSRGRVQVSPTSELTVDAYVGKLFAQLRNTHHGYELDHETKLALIDSHTGHIPVSFPELAVLYSLALVADASTAFSGKWLR